MLLIKRLKTMARKDDFWATAGSVIAGVIGGMILVEIIKNASSKKCATCNNFNELNLQYCKFCGMRLP